MLSAVSKSFIDIQDRLLAIAGAAAIPPPASPGSEDAGRTLLQDYSDTPN